MHSELKKVWALRRNIKIAHPDDLAVARGGCASCGRPAVTFVRYSGAHLCERHFTGFIASKVGREFRKQVKLPERSTLAVAVSGGKDSVVALRILHELLSERRGTEIVAITVDEGVMSYRPDAIRIAGRNCKAIGVEHRIISFKETFGLTLDSARGAWGSKSPCTYCGVLRRHCLNLEARRLGADYLATGLNLDDTAQSILMNICRGDVGRLARLGPHGGSRAQEGLVARIQPLRQVTDKESFLYATLKGFPVHHSVCPYAGDAMRNRFREIVQELERASPGTRFCILNSYDEIKKWLEPHFPPAMLAACRSCGEPSVDEMCEACKLARLLRKG
jgi:uncharacterized protein (TIGR00269 family)